MRGQPNHYIIEKWKNKFISNFKRNKPWKYLTFHQTLTDLYDEDKQVKYIIDNMVQISEKIPHSALKLGWSDKKPSYVYKRADLKSITYDEKQTQNTMTMKQNLVLQDNSPKDNSTRE